MHMPAKTTLLIGLAVPVLAWGQAKNEPPAAAAAKTSDKLLTAVSSEEYFQSIDDYLKVVRAQMVDTAFPLARREAIAFETLGLLRGRVGEAPSPDDALKAWAILIDVAENFSARHPGHPMAERFQLTIAEAWWQRSRLVSRIAIGNRSDKTGDLAKPDRDKARAILEKIVGSNGPANDPFAQSARYLLAQSLADELVASPKIEQATASASREKILKLTEGLDSDSMHDWAILLRARTLADLGRLDDARNELEKTAEAFRHRYSAAWAESKTTVLTKCGRYDEADHFLASTDLPTGLYARLRIALWADRVKKPVPPDEEPQMRKAVFEAAAKLKGREDFDAAQAWLALSRSQIQPAADSPSAWWATLAESHLRNNRPDQAAKALDEAARRAGVEKQPQLQIQYEFQSGAAWFKSGQPNQAQSRLLKVVEQKSAGDLGPRASLLRVMSLKSMGLSGRTLLDEAIAEHIRRFSDDKITTGEVHWLEGETDAAAGRRDEAIIAWQAIGPTHPRWLPSRLASTRLDLDRLDELALISDNRQFAAEWDKARKRMEKARDEAPSSADKASMELAIARIDLTPGSDRVEAARQTALRLLPNLTRDNQRQWAQSILILADALLGRALDLESRLTQRDKAMDATLLLDMCRVLDTAAGIIDTENTRRQLGSAMAKLAASLPPTSPDFSPDINQELELRRIRGLIYAGQPSAAEPRLDTWIKANPNVRPAMLYAVADALLRLNATAKAIGYLSEWVGHEPEGSTQWFLGRLELAKALYREGRDAEALKLLDATLLLYPEAGGTGLKRKYDRLRRSIGK